MAKPWEENWCVHPLRREIVCHLDGDNGIDRRAPHASFCGPYDLIRPEGNARARLAAQAPAMARLLLEIKDHACACPEGNIAKCLFCNNNPHDLDCRLIDVLTAAGISAR